RSEVKNSIHHQGRGLDRDATSAHAWHVTSKTRRPGERERVHVRRIDLLERAVAPSGVVAVVCGPGVRWQLEQLGRIEFLCAHRSGDEKKKMPEFHFRVTR